MNRIDDIKARADSQTVDILHALKDIPFLLAYIERLEKIPKLTREYLSGWDEMSDDLVSALTALDSFIASQTKESTNDHK